MLNIEEIKARCEKATPGPWSVDTNMPFSRAIQGVFADNQNKYVFYIEDADDAEKPLKSIDATFIAAARTDIPALIAEVERMTEQHRCDVHNIAAMQATLEQQAKNCEKLLSDDKQQIDTMKNALEAACDEIAKRVVEKAGSITAPFRQEVKETLIEQYIGQEQEDNK